MPSPPVFANELGPTTPVCRGSFTLRKRTTHLDPRVQLFPAGADDAQNHSILTVEPAVRLSPRSFAGDRPHLSKTETQVRLTVVPNSSQEN